MPHWVREDVASRLGEIARRLHDQGADRYRVEASVDADPVVLLQTVPAIGRVLAGRLHDELRPFKDDPLQAR